MPTYAPAAAPPVTCPNCGFALVPPPPPPPPERPTPRSVTPEPPEPPAVEAVVSPERHGVRAASVPQILLGLGAFCLLVAGVIFLAVAWTWLGLGGRTVALVALTGATGWAGHWFARKPLPLAAEALTTVCLGLVVLDLVGASLAGWLGSPLGGGFGTLVGIVLLAAGLGLCALDRLVVSQLGATAGLAVAAVGMAGQTGHLQLTATVAVPGFVLLAVAGDRLGGLVLPFSAGAGAVLSWTLLAVSGLADALTHPSLGALWGEGHAWGLVGAAAPVLPFGFVPAAGLLRQAAIALSATIVTLVLVLPAVDEGATTIALTALVATLVWAAISATTPPHWYAAPRIPLALSASVVVAVVVAVAASALITLATVGVPFSTGAGVRLMPVPALAAAYVLPVGVVGLVVAAFLALPRTGATTVVSAAVLGVTGVLTLALFPVPLWVVVVVLAAGSAGLLAAALRHDGQRGAGEATGAALAASAAVVLALPSAVLATVVLALVVAGAVLTLARGRFPGANAVASLVLPIAVTGLVIAAGEVAGLSWSHRSVVVLVVVGLLTVQRPRVETEVAGWTSIGLVSAYGLAVPPDLSSGLALQLTIAGIVLCASALTHADRRPLAWVGGLLLAAATWVRLAELGVTTPEAYTLPSAVVLIWFGLRRLNRDHGASTWMALGAGLSLATMPSLMFVLVDPLSSRAVLLGGACLLLVLAGARMWWNAPLVIGASVGSAVVLWELAPFALLTPQWVLIALAGTTLMVVGVTWEARVRDLHRTTAWLGRLR